MKLGGRMGRMRRKMMNQMERDQRSRKSAGRMLSSLGVTLFFF